MPFPRSAPLPARNVQVLRSAQSSGTGSATGASKGPTLSAVRDGSAGRSAGSGRSALVSGSQCSGWRAQTQGELDPWDEMPDCHQHLAEIVGTDPLKCAKAEAMLDICFAKHLEDVTKLGLQVYQLRLSAACRISQIDGVERRSLAPAGSRSL